MPFHNPSVLVATLDSPPLPPFRGNTRVKSISVEDFIQTNGCLIVTDVEKSATVSVTREISDYMDFALQEKRRSSQIACVASDDSYKGVQHHADSGSYCLSAFLKLSKELGETSRGNVVIPFPDRTIPVPKGHAMADPIMTNLLPDFIENEGITSFSDFGAGLGQYMEWRSNVFSPILCFIRHTAVRAISKFTPRALSNSLISQFLCTYLIRTGPCCLRLENMYRQT